MVFALLLAWSAETGLAEQTPATLRKQLARSGRTKEVAVLLLHSLAYVFASKFFILQFCVNSVMSWWCVLQPTHTDLLATGLLQIQACTRPLARAKAPLVRL